MKEETQSSLERDLIDFEQAAKLEQRRQRRPYFSQSEISPVRRPWQQRVLFGLVATSLLTMLIAWVVAGKQTTPDFSMIGEGWRPRIPYISDRLPYPVWLLLLLCLYQLVIYAGRGVDALGRQFGVLFFRIPLAFRLTAEALLGVALVGMYCVFMYFFGMLIMNALNFRLDDSRPTKITTALIENIPSRTWKRPPTLRIADWRSPSTSKYVVVSGYVTVFEIKGNEVTFYLRGGAFGWPYAIEKSFVARYEEAASEGAQQQLGQRRTTSRFTLLTQLVNSTGSMNVSPLSAKAQ